MRLNCSLYVDVGYLLASAATRVTGTSLRSGIHVDYRTIIEALIQQASELSGLSVLRVHWYDSARNGLPDQQQERIGELPKVKLRLGRFGVDGQQKGVDLRIGLDLVAHARNSASSVFFLVSGDDDLTEAVEEAQAHGVEVVVLAVPNAQGAAHGVSRHLLRAADDLVLVSTEALDSAVLKVELPQPSADSATPSPAALAARPRPTPADVAAAATVRPPVPSPAELAALRRPAAPAPESVLAYSGASGRAPQIMPGYGDAESFDDEIDSVVRHVVASFNQSASPDEVAALRRSRPSIPRDIDKALLLDLCDAIDVYDLSDPVRFRLRDHFWEVLEETP